MRKEIPTSSYERLFYNGENIQIAEMIGDIIGWCQSQTIKQGNFFRKNNK